MSRNSAPKFIFVVPVLLSLFLLQTVGCGSGSSSSSSSSTSSSSSSGGTTQTAAETAAQTTFTSGGKSLATSTTSTATSKTVTVTDSNGTVVLTLVATLTGLTMSSPSHVGDDATMTYRTALTALPTDYEVRRMAIFAAGPMKVDSGLALKARPDSPGCDWFPDTQCTLGCCADHDKCYQDNNCGASSWIWGFGSEACKNCNNIAYDCIGAACVGVTESFTDNNCYDHACRKFYDCTGKDNCDCDSPCLLEAATTPPSTCGDGTCGTGENLSNCFTDCGSGTSASSCCASHSHPDETGSSCGSAGSPCCCGDGFACDWHVSASSTQNICVTSND